MSACHPISESCRRTAAMGIVLVNVELKSLFCSSFGSTYGITCCIRINSFFDKCAALTEVHPPHVLLSRHCDNWFPIQEYDYKIMEASKKTTNRLEVIAESS